MPLLRAGDLFPQLTVTVPGGTAVPGVFISEDPLYLQSAGFVLSPRGTVIVSVYSSGAIGRLIPEEVTGLVRYVRQHAAAS